jgi:glycosyltransferase involved in cell wall biosynthesis
MEWRALLTATDIIRRQQVDAVHTHMFNAAFLGSVAGSLTGVPVVITEHGMQVTAEEVALVRLTGSHLVTVCTAAYRMGLSLGLPEDQISLIPNGVDTQAFHPRASGQAFREQIGVPAGVPLVGMVARLSREKGPDLFVQAAMLVAASCREAHFVLAGDGPMRDGLARQIEALGLAGRFHLPGLIADTSAVYSALDVVCLPSRMEGQPLCLLEAMAAARPVVATNVGGIAEIVELGETGWLVAAGDVSALSERILWLLADPERAREMGQAGRQRVLDAFDIRKQAATVAALFRQLVDSRRRQMRTTLQLGRVYGQARVS